MVLEDTQELLPLSFRRDFRSRIRLGLNHGNWRSIIHSLDSGRSSSGLGDLGPEETGAHGLEAVRLAVFLALGDVFDLATALLGRLRRLVLLVQAQHVEADADVLEGVPGELGDGRDHVREGRLGLEVLRESEQR